MRCLPDRQPVFCHNDTYHGNVMLLDDGTIKLLDFEFSCRNHIAFDFANLFAETVMEHGFADPPHFRSASRVHRRDLSTFIGFYLDNVEFAKRRIAQQSCNASSAKPAGALAVGLHVCHGRVAARLEPIQKIRFIPYAHQRFQSS